MVMLIALSATTSGPSTYSYTKFFPVSPHDCRYNNRIAMAWAPGDLVDKAKRDFCAPAFFHSLSWQRRWTDIGGVPVLNSVTYTSVSADLNARNYCDGGSPIILLNEPDLPGQDDIPVSMSVEIYRFISAVLPDCTIYWPNAIDRSYLSAALSELGHDLRQGDVIGMHIYQNGNPNSPTEWPGVWIESIRALLIEHGVGNKIAITEVGPKALWSSADLDRYYFELAESEATWIFVYSPHCGGYGGHACERNLYATRDGVGFTESGKALRRLMFGGFMFHPPD